MGRSAVLLVLLLAAAAAEGSQPRAVRLDLESNPELVDLRGVTRFEIVPADRLHRVQIELDGEVIAKAVATPVVVDVDLGNELVQHVLRVAGRSESGTPGVWLHTINEGRQPFAITMLRTPAGVTVDVSAPAGEEIAAVDLYAGGTRIATLDRAPYTFATSTSGTMVATARTRSGREAVAFVDDSAGWVETRDVRIRTISVGLSGATAESPRREDFRITDSGSPAQVKSVVRAEAQPLNVALLVDASDSMRPHIDGVRAAASSFVRALWRSGDQFSVFSIHDVPRRQQALTSDKTPVLDAISRIQPHGATALHDAVGSAMRELSGAGGRKAIVLLSDGNDTDSLMTFEELSDALRASSIPLYAVAFGVSSGSRELDRLEYLVRQNGGVVVAASSETIAAAYEAIERDLRNQYLVTYEVASSGATGKWHPITVSTTRPGEMVRTILGYFSD